MTAAITCAKKRRNGLKKASKPGFTNEIQENFEKTKKGSSRHDRIIARRLGF